MSRALGAALAGRRVLVVEDEYVLADDVRGVLEAAGATVIGPVGSVRAALDLLSGGASPDAAVLDVNLGGEAVFPVVDALRARNVNLVFTTGYDAWALPEAYADVARCEKPVDMRRLVRALEA